MGTIRTAIAFPGENTIALFSRSGRANSGAPWLPAGEVQSPWDIAAAAFALGGETLLLMSHHGALSHISTVDGRAMASTPAIDDTDGHVWQAACRLQEKNIARLAMRPTASAIKEP